MSQTDLDHGRAGARKRAPKANQPAKPIDRSPKSMVIRIGASEVGRSVSQLVKDTRKIMEPGTASRLREMRKNKLRDFTSMAGPLGVTHLLMFSKSTSGHTNLRMAITPRGPTLHFRVENYSLAKDVLKSQRHPVASDKLYLQPPLLVMNNFTSAAQPEGSEPSEGQVPKHLESLVTTVFQSLFPPLNPQTTPLRSIKRVLLLNREVPTDPSNGAYTITLRHYAITIKTTGASKPVRRLNNAAKPRKGTKKGRNMPNLGQLADVADYLLEPDAGNYTSASESEPDTDAEVEILKADNRRLSERARARARAEEDMGVNGEGSSSVEKRAVKLSEIGPRMRLKLLKVEEGLCEGKVMWHEFIHKSKDEERQLDQVWEKRKKEKEERKRIQRENVERKRKDKAANKKTKGGEEDDDEEMEDYEDWDSEDFQVAAEMDVDDDDDEDEQLG